MYQTNDLDHGGMYLWDQEIPTCPTHGLSIFDDYTCTQCRLELENASVKANSKNEKGVSGLPEGMNPNTMTSGKNQAILRRLKNERKKTRKKARKKS